MEDLKKFSDFHKLNESAPIDKLEYGFMKTSDYGNASETITSTLVLLQEEFERYCRENGYDAQGNDEDMTWGNIKNSLSWGDE